MKNQRGISKSERAYYARNDLQKCVVCGRLFCRRKDNVCSRDCLAKLEASEKKASAGQ
jgi:ferredoxin